MNTIKLINRILVTGGKGAVGKYVKTVFDKNTVFLLGKESLDVTDINHVQEAFKKLKPDVVIHLAALTNVDLCEKNQKLAKKINFDGTRNVALICKSNNIPLIYVSTSAVFDGKSMNGYSERDIPNPVNTYAKTKLLGEKFIMENLDKYIIVRAAWMIGGAKKEKKFISYIFDKIKKGETLRIVNDKFGTLTYSRDLLSFIKDRLSNYDYGLYHYGSTGVCSRYDMANFVKNFLNSSSKIIPASSREFEEKFSAPRPKYEVIRSMKYPFKDSWKNTLKKYITNDLV